MTGKKKLWGIASIIAAAAIVAVVTYFLFSGGSKSGSVLPSYANLLREGKYKGIYSLISNDAKKRWK